VTTRCALQVAQRRIHNSFFNLQKYGFKHFVISQKLLVQSTCVSTRCAQQVGALWKPGMPEYHGIWRNITEYAGISWNMAEYHGISRLFPGIYRNITIFSHGSHATVYKHGRLTTYDYKSDGSFPFWHREQRSRVYLVNQDKHRLTLLIVVYFIVKSQCSH
jgi:hypothetical protein